MQTLVRQELAALETELALCERCFGPERRASVRFDRPEDDAEIIVLLERPPRASLVRGERLSLRVPDAGMDFLGQMLAEAQLPVTRTLIGTCMMCRPQVRRLETTVPLPVCVEECAGHVAELLRVIRPRLVLTVGRVALRSLRAAWAGRSELAAVRFPESVGLPVVTEDSTVIPLYHVTPRARLARPEVEQRADWRRVGRVWRSLVPA